MSETLSPEEGKLLLELCRSGKLYEVEKWIASGRSIRTAVNQKTPLRIALDLGFHSLVEVLIRAEDRVEIKNKALAEAVDKKRIDLVELLVAYGAEIRSVPLCDVLLTWEPRMMMFFLDRDVDVITGTPFAVAFREKVRTALRPYLEYKKAHPEFAATLQEQADRALRHFCYKGDLKWVSLLLWAGANPRSRGPDDDRWVDDPECHTTAMREACSKGNLDVLKRLKIDPRLDDVSELLASATLVIPKETAEYLFSLGAKPNDKPNGGSSALDQCLWYLGLPNFGSAFERRLATRFDVDPTLNCIRVLVEHGARWVPEDRNRINSVRKSLYSCEPDVVVDLVKLLARNRACPEETLDQLLETPRMREHLSRLGMKLLGPSLKRPRARQ